MVEKLHRRRGISEEGKNTQISLKLPEGLLERVNTAAKADPSFTGRGHYIESAIRFYLDTITCPKCGKRINKDSKICPFCETRIKYYDEYQEVLKGCLEDNDKYVNDATKYLKLTIDLEKDFQNHVKERPQEEQDFIKKSRDFIILRKGIEQTCDITKNYLNLIDKYNSLSDEELRQVKMEVDVVNDLKRSENPGVNALLFPKNIEKEILEYLLIKRKYNKNMHFDNISLWELENDIHALEIFGLSAGKIAREIEMNYNSFKMVDLVLTEGK